MPICGDNANESNEAFGGLLFDVVNAGCLTDSCGAVSSILNDDATPDPIPAPAPGPSLSVANTSALEGDGILRGAALRFTITLAPASSREVTVTAKTALGDKTLGALAKGSTNCVTGADYVTETELVRFTRGETEKTVLVTICGDNLNEANENLALVLSSPTGATIADGGAVGVIVDDD